MKRKSFIPIGLVAAIIMTLFLSGCGIAGSDEEAIASSVTDALSQVNSVETSVLVDIQAHIGSTGSSDSHTGSLGSDITIQSNFDTGAYHAEYFSRINVDGAASREDREYYVVFEDEEYVRYESDTTTDDWTKTIVPIADAAALHLKSGLLSDWGTILNNCRLDTSEVEVEDQVADMLVGTVRASIIQELIGDKIFGSFMYSVEQLLNDEIPCTIYINSETSLPVQIVLDFSEQFITSDMIIDAAQIVVTYSRWDEAGVVSVPKKISIVATDVENDFYSNYFTWNLFLPYINGDDHSGNGNGGGGLHFASSWNTYQVRIDNELTTLPFAYENLTNLGYTIDSNYDSTIVEPNKYIDHVPVFKNNDILYCTFYNADTSAQPITSCDIGCIDISASDQKENGIKLFLPGEITLGVTEESLKSAYGDPNETIQAFACDTYKWTTENTNQSFMAEISPVTKQVIRLQLKNVPVTGGKQ